jgi:hypothetical protein
MQRSPYEIGGSEQRWFKESLVPSEPSINLAIAARSTMSILSGSRISINAGLIIKLEIRCTL